MSDALVIEPGRVIMRGEWAEEIIFDVTWSETENLAAFEAAFEIVPGDHQAGTDYYQGLDFMALIRRRLDGALFGYPRWRRLAKHYDEECEPNGEGHGFEDDWDSGAEHVGVYVWLPVETFTITGYRIKGGSNA